ncbi:hypothetical protein TNCV_1055451, partial [Trichonephila clavipes]
SGSHTCDSRHRVTSSNPDATKESQYREAEMHVKSAMAPSPGVGMVWRFGEKGQVKWTIPELPPSHNHNTNQTKASSDRFKVHRSHQHGGASEALGLKPATGQCWLRVRDHDYEPRRIRASLHMPQARVLCLKPELTKGSVLGIGQILGPLESSPPPPAMRGCTLRL